MPSRRKKSAVNKRQGRRFVRLNPKIFRMFKRVTLTIFLLLVFYETWIFAQVLWLKWNEPSTTSFMSLRQEEMDENGKTAKLRYEWVDYSRISNHLKRAVIAAEDGKRDAFKHTKNLGVEPDNPATLAFIDGGFFTTTRH